MDPKHCSKQPSNQKGTLLMYISFTCRQPDFLLDILQRQGTNQAMPWLADLVESNEGRSHLPNIWSFSKVLALPNNKYFYWGGKQIWYHLTWS